jgi:hypothetical protein
MSGRGPPGTSVGKPSSLGLVVVNLQNKDDICQGIVNGEDKNGGEKFL